jgi:LysM repeat protein
MRNLTAAGVWSGTASRRLTWLAAFLLCALFLPAAPAHAQAQIHVVSAGETLSSIATHYGTTAAVVASANALSNPNLIYAGQRLTIPAGSAGSTPAGGSYVVQVGDTLASIATRHGTTAAAIAAANGLANPNYIYPGQQLQIPAAGAAPAAPQPSGALAHVVSRGETLSSIAVRYGTTAAAIAATNGLANPNYVYAGQRLRIPSAGAPAPAPAPVGSRRIVVDLSDQRMYVYQDGQLLWSWIVSTGRPGQETAVGHYKVLNKLPNAYAYTWGLQMPYWLGIYWAGHLQNGIHALPIQGNGQRLWEGYLGQRVSYGCVILSTENASTLYNWATVGTPVDIVW